VVGNRTLVKVKKNKVAPPFTQCEFDIMYNEGISRTGDVVDLGLAYGILDKRGTYFRYGDILIGQGRENAKFYLAENRDMLDEIEELVRANAGLSTDGGSVHPEYMDDAAADEIKRASLVSP